MMAGRLGVLRRLFGEGGALAVVLSVLAVEFDDAKAESRRASSADSSDFLYVDALGFGDVLGRRTLLSHPREEGALEEVLVALDVAGVSGFWSCEGGDSDCEVATVTSPSGVCPASSLMAFGVFASFHEDSLGNEQRRLVL
jgi:hypothetical protein